MLESKVTKKSLAEDMIRQFPGGTSKGIARKLLAAYPETFDTIDNARGAVRLVRGAMGKGDKNAVIDLIRPFGTQSDQVSLPQSFANVRDVYKIKGERIAILSDIHIPYHDVSSLTLAMNRCRELEVDTVLLNGDVMDFHQLSDHEHDPRSRSIKQELDAVKQFFDYLRVQFPDVSVHYKLGNHEDRYQRFMAKKAPELMDVDAWRIDKLLSTDDFGIRIVDDFRIVKLGKLNVLHGHEYKYGMAMPVNPARGIFLRAKESTLAGHHHRTSEHTEQSLTRDIVTCWSTGCLCELSPRYNPYNNWNHGFALVKLEQGNYSVDNYRIWGGRIL